jgi:hypothetical protein
LKGEIATKEKGKINRKKRKLNWIAVSPTVYSYRPTI